MLYIQPVVNYESAVAYHFSSDQEEAIQRTVAYRQKDVDLSVIFFHPNTHDNLAKYIPGGFRQSVASLGDLDFLPLELIHEIFYQCDMASLFRLRQINNRAREIIDSLREYRTIVKHALNSFRALLHTRTAQEVTLLDFDHLLCTQNCTVCDREYANLVYLPTWIRCCFTCLRDHETPMLRTTTIASARRVLQLPETSLETLPRLKTIAGTYSMTQSRRIGRHNLVPEHLVLSLYRAENDGRDPPADMVERLNTQSIFAFMSCCAIPTYTAEKADVDHGVCCAGCEVFLQRAMWRQPTQQAIENANIVFSPKGYLEHFKWCLQAQLLWEESDCGRRVPPRMPGCATKGGSFDLRRLNGVV